ncbi:hypothetical protein SAMN04488129_104202 [Halomonas daqiaonensis]|uniref:Uncharacterized protein n=1 Tax=Halomonas daqiaonensis TaxID=650850 RepID=A0A1H7K213_9GAMM|nr:hypothetical protein SAMN04488129_104202 [Halomonas daqiaonensis]
MAGRDFWLDDAAGRAAWSNSGGYCGRLAALHQIVDARGSRSV